MLAKVSEVISEGCSIGCANAQLVEIITAYATCNVNLKTCDVRLCRRTLNEHAYICTYTNKVETSYHQQWPLEATTSL